MNDSPHKENKEKENPVKNYAHLLDRVGDDPWGGQQASVPF